MRCVIYPSAARTSPLNWLQILFSHKNESCVAFEQNITCKKICRQNLNLIFDTRRKARLWTLAENFWVKLFVSCLDVVVVVIIAVVVVVAAVVVVVAAVVVAVAVDDTDISTAAAVQVSGQCRMLLVDQGIWGRGTTEVVLQIRTKLFYHLEFLHFFLGNER